MEKPRSTPSRYLARVSNAAIPFFVFVLLCLAISGNLGEAMGVPSLFRDDPDLQRYRTWIFHSSSVWGQVAATLLVFIFWSGVGVSERLRQHRSGQPAADAHPTNEARVRFVATNSAPFLALLLVAAVYPSVVPLRLGRVFAELAKALLGMGVAVLLVAVLLAAMLWIKRKFFEHPAVKGALTQATVQRHVRRVRALAVPRERQKSPHGPVPDDVVDDFLLFLTIVGFATTVFTFAPVILPCVAIALLAIWVTTFYFVFVFLKSSLRLPAVAAAGFLTVCCNHDPFASRFPGVGDYDHPIAVSKKAVVEQDKTEGAGEKPGGRCTQEPAARGPSAGIDPVDALNAWLDRGGRRKLVIVAVSGGAYRAGFWSAIVLDEIARQSRPGGSMPGLGGAIELLTGASGGMVASAYWAALAGVPSVDPPGIEATLRADIKKFRDRRGTHPGKFATPVPIDRDGLSPVAEELVQRDMPRYLLSRLFSWDSWDDRGLVLEQQWRTLDRTFSELAEGERSGVRPSIILSPMMIETGQPLLISNLDLCELTASEQAVELFALFPEARATLRLQTAVRMNASFPYVSPAISLPTKPTRRVVDAGYYDNYGVSVAASWLSMPRVRDWITSHTDGVLVVQIRAYGSEYESKEPSASGIAARFLTSPIEGMFAARDSSMLFRNAEQLATVTRLYPPGFVETFAFENKAERNAVEMSWYVTTDALGAMDSELKKAKPKFDDLAKAWSSGLPQRNELRKEASAR